VIALLSIRHGMTAESPCDDTVSAPCKEASGPFLHSCFPNPDPPYFSSTSYSAGNNIDTCDPAIGPGQCRLEDNTKCIYTVFGNDCLGNAFSYSQTNTVFEWSCRF